MFAFDQRIVRDAIDRIRRFAILKPVMAEAICLDAISVGGVEIPGSGHTLRAKLSKRVERGFEHENVGVEAIG